jgi:peptide/nickel transport system permease protein
MKKYILKRLLQLIPTLFGVALITFILFNVVGGSPALLVLGKNATAEAIAEYDHIHGYDKPLLIQFFNFIGDLVAGDWGESIDYQQPVLDVLKNGVLISLSLTLPILIIGTLVAIGISLICAAFAGKWQDNVALAGTTMLMSVNYVIWVTAGQYFLAYKLKLFPIWGYENWTYLCLPVIIGVINGLGGDVRFYRTVIMDEINKPHVRTAIAKGLHPTYILLKHVLRNSLIPITTNISLSIPFLFTGSILLESFYGIPGLGGIGLNAVNSSDIAMVRAVVIIGAILYQLSNLISDIIYAWLDPRVRMQ